MLAVVMVLGILGLGIGIGSLITDRVDATGPGDSRLEMQEGKPVVGDSVLSLSRAFEDVSSRVEPAVVNINTEEVISRRRQQMPRSAPGDPMFDFFERFFGGVPQMPEQQTVRSLGSGVIVDPKGYIITNNHVVEGATRIRVSVVGQGEYSARIVGADPISDIAVIKISGDKPFAYAKVGNSKGMKVGDWVLAIGSPFGLEQTVTAGIISTTGRTFKEREGPSEYSVFNEYLQTDAAINRGNSGGPGEHERRGDRDQQLHLHLLGIQRRDRVRGPLPTVCQGLQPNPETGKVSRGWIGVSMNSLPSPRRWPNSSR